MHPLSLAMTTESFLVTPILLCRVVPTDQVALPYSSHQAIALTPVHRLINTL